MDFDQMLEAWKGQNDKPPYDVNRDALRQALQAEEARVRKELRTRRREIWVGAILGTGMAVWAGFWIAITLTNGWPAIYAIASGASFGIFAFGAGALWVSRGRKPERNFGNTLQEEVKRNLALIDDQLVLTKRWILFMLGWGSVIAGTGLFSWTTNASQEIAGASSFKAWLLFTFIFMGLIVSASFKQRDAMREAKPKLKLRQRHLRELLETLDASR